MSRGRAKIVLLGKCFLMFLPFFEEVFASTGKETECFKPRKQEANEEWIYLHGLDEPSLSPQERDNRRVLKDFSEKKKINIAMPRATDVCKGRLCWLHYDASTVEKNMKKILEASRPCLKNPSHASILGFSNGGYFTAKLVQYCIANSFKRRISVGGAPTFSKSLDKDKTRACGKLDFLMGSKDINFKKAKAYADAMQANGYNIEWLEFKGGHEIKMEAITEAIGLH